MNFLDAVKLAKANEHLIGKDYLNGRIDEVIIVPTNEIEFDKYKRIFKKTLDAQKAIEPFMESDVEVWLLINKKLIGAYPPLFLHIRLHDLPSEYGAKLSLPKE